MAMSDAEIADVLDRTVATCEPILEVLRTTDPFGLKKRTHGPRTFWLIPRNPRDLGAALLNVTDVPGTKGWDELSMDDRADWWEKRIGGIGTVGAAFPSLFGAWLNRLPIADFAAAGDQALVTIAVANEYGVTDRNSQIAMLGNVIFGRDDIDSSDLAHKDPKPLKQSGKELTKKVITSVWEIGKELYGLKKAIGVRPRAPKPVRMLTNIPVVGTPFQYVGERVALREAVKRSKKWIAAHPEAVGKTS